MLDILKSLLGDSITMFTIMNPLSAGAIMLTLVESNTSKKEFHHLAIKNSRAVFVAMVIIFLSGNYIFQFFGIQPAGLRVFGGVILLMMGFNMVQGHDKKVNHKPQDQKAAQERNDISVVPLAIPIMVGPGLASTLVNLGVNAHKWQNYASVIGAIAVCALASFIIFKRMPFIKKKLGVNGLKVFNRLMGLIVGSLAAQMLISGIIGLYQNHFN